MTKSPPDACRCDASPWPHLHVAENRPCWGAGRDIFRDSEQTKREEFRELARTDHDAAKAALVKEIFG